MEAFASCLGGGKGLFLCPSDSDGRSTVTGSAGRVHWGLGRATSSRRSFCGVTLWGPGLEPEDPILFLRVLKTLILHLHNKLCYSLSHLWRFLTLLWSIQLQSVSHRLTFPLKQNLWPDSLIPALPPQKNIWVQAWNPIICPEPCLAGVKINFLNFFAAVRRTSMQFKLPSSYLSLWL